MFKTKAQTLLKFNKVCFGYKPKQSILNNVSFAIAKGQHVCLVGANGCGKSTLAKLMAGLYKPSSGHIEFNHHLVTQDNVLDFQKVTGIIFDDPNSQFIGLTVQDEIAFGLENKQIPRNQMQSIINNVARQVGITDLLKSATKDLSGGQKQLVAIAAVLAMDPDLIIFDEVNSMLDAQSKQKINYIISYLNKKQHKTVVCVTHDMNEVLHADQVIVMDKGKIITIGKPLEIFNSNKLNNLSIDKPFVLKLAKKLNLKQTTDLNKLVKEVAYAK